VAVLVEGISVIVRLDRVAEKYPNGRDAFFRDVPNSTLCHDEKIARSGFLSPREVKDYIEFLESRGLGRVDKRDSQSLRLLIQDCFLRSSHGSRRLVGCGVGTDRAAAAA